MQTTRTLPALIAAGALLIACGDDDTSPGGATTTTAMATTTVAATTTAAMVTTTAATTTSAMATTTAPSTTTTEAFTTTTEVLAQLAIWPAAEVVFATPEEAAADFVRTVLGVAPVLGDYVGGDSMSGEIEVFSPGEETTPVSRGVLFLRKLAPHDGWFVIGAANPNATISTPETYAEVAAAVLPVEGVARGFEATVVVTAFLAGDADAVLDQVITSGGAFETPEPYGVTIDLSGAAPGDVITLLVRGDTGLETDPGEFGAIAVVIAD